MDTANSQIAAIQISGDFALMPAGEAADAALRSGFGALSGGKLKLNLLEAAYLVERKKAVILVGKKETSPEKLLASKKTAKGGVALSDQYVVFKALRQNGHVVRFTPSSPLLWRVYARGVGREQDRPCTLVSLVGKDWKATVPSLERMLATARSLRLELALCFVDGKRPHLVKLGKAAIEV